jgi:hypothetical protein
MSQLYDVATRFWEELVSCLTGPLALRSIPESAAIFPFIFPADAETMCIATVEKDTARETQFVRRG